MPFVLFGGPHLVVLALDACDADASGILAFWLRRERRADAFIHRFFATLLICRRTS